MANQPQAKNEVHLSRFIKAKRDKVYDAWTKPEVMKLWFAPAPLRPGPIEGDLRVGGKFRSVMLGDDRNHVAYGVYKEIVPGKKLVFTHQWEGDDTGPTTVTVEFKDQDDGTMITLTHQGLPNEAETKGHAQGWSDTIDNLEKVFAKG